MKSLAFLIVSLCLFSCSSRIKSAGCYKHPSLGGPYMINNFDDHTVNIPDKMDPLKVKIVGNSSLWKMATCPMN